MKLSLNNLSDIDIVARKFVENMGDNNVFAFYGQMGVLRASVSDADPRHHTEAEKCDHNRYVRARRGL